MKKVKPGDPLKAEDWNKMVTAIRWIGLMALFGVLESLGAILYLILT